MLHAKFQDHRTSGSGEEDFLRFLQSVRPGPFIKYKLSFPLPKEAPQKIWLSLAERFQRRIRLKMVDDDDDNAGRRSMCIL